MAAKFREIILALVTKVHEVVADDASVIVVARRELPALTGDFDVLLRVRNMRDTEGTTDAAGRQAMFIRRYIDVIMRARQYADVSRQDLQWLTDETNGILELEYQLMDLLQLWFPIAGDGGDEPTPLLIEPARIITGDDPIRDLIQGRGQVNSDPGYGTLGFRLDTYYWQLLRQDVQ
jgi:hypothetical protein